MFPALQHHKNIVMKNVQQQIGKDGSLWARRELHCFPCPCLGPPRSHTCSHPQTSVPEGMELQMESQLCAKPEQLRKAYPNCGAAAVVPRHGQGTQGWGRAVPTLPWTLTPTLQPLQQTHRAQVTNPQNQNDILPCWGKSPVPQVGDGGEARLCFHWRPAHLQLSSGED